MCRVMHLLIGCKDGRGSSFLNFRFEQEGGGLNGVRRCIGPPGTLLHWAVLKDKVELATLLLSKNANVEALDDEEQTPLFAAAALAWVVGHSGMVELLLEHRAQVCPSHANGSTAVHGGGRHVRWREACPRPFVEGGPKGVATERQAKRAHTVGRGEEGRPD